MLISPIKQMSPITRDVKISNKAKFQIWRPNKMRCKKCENKRQGFWLLLTENVSFLFFLSFFLSFFFFKRLPFCMSETWLYYWRVLVVEPWKHNGETFLVPRWSHLVLPCLVPGPLVSGRKEERGEGRKERREGGRNEGRKTNKQRKNQTNRRSKK